MLPDVHDGEEYPRTETEVVCGGGPPHEWGHGSGDGADGGVPPGESFHGGVDEHVEEGALECEECGEQVDVEQEQEAPGEGHEYAEVECDSGGYHACG